MSINARRAVTLDLFCKVVDNFGDIGICWRLARQLQREHGLAVRLWVDDLSSFRRLCPQVDVDKAIQCIDRVTVCHWRAQDGDFAPVDVADIVIEFFGCDIPPGYIAAMAELARLDRAPVWLNLEGLSAEEWVEGCHTLPSPHPRLPLTKYFFFPGFSANTGGLLIESDLARDRTSFLTDPSRRLEFLAGLAIPRETAQELLVSLFCYPQAPLADLFTVWQGGVEAVTCLVPEGVAVAPVVAFLSQPAVTGAARTRGKLTIRVVPFLAQPDYDRLLWACDLNFVRGEDSFVRAQLACKPFIWHIYPQDKDLHHVKLRAFLHRYAQQNEPLQQFSLAWNGALGSSALQQTWEQNWSQLRGDWRVLTENAERWNAGLLGIGDLATNLVKFARQHRSEVQQNKV